MHLETSTACSKRKGTEGIEARGKSLANRAAPFVWVGHYRVCHPQESIFIPSGFRETQGYPSPVLATSASPW